MLSNFSIYWYTYLKSLSSFSLSISMVCLTSICPPLLLSSSILEIHVSHDVIHTIIYFPPLVFSLFRRLFPQAPTHQLQAAGAFSGFQRINWDPNVKALSTNFNTSIFPCNIWKILNLSFGLQERRPNVYARQDFH